MLEGGRPLTAINRDCYCKKIEPVGQLQSQISFLEREKSDLERNLKDAITKQHEAMKRALTLADRNTQLEQELQDMDRVALKVEADSNTAVRNANDKVSRLEEKVCQLLLQIKCLEREIKELKQDKQALMSDFDAMKVEKRHLQSVLETTLDDKNRISNQLNKFTSIEHDLNLEIDRLVQTSATQKRKIIELECQLLNGKIGKPDTAVKCDCKQTKEVTNSKLGNNLKELNKNKCKNKGAIKKSKTKNPCLRPKCKKSPKKKSSPKRVTPATSCKSSLTDCNMFMNNTKALTKCESPNNDCIGKNQKSCHCCKNYLDRGNDENKSSMERVRTQRDCYQKEFKKLSDEICTTCKTSNETSCEADRAKDRLIATLQHENKTLAHEKHNLMTRLESARENMDSGDYDGFSAKCTLRKVERERDMLKSDVDRLEEERDALRKRLRATMDTQLAERTRLEKALADMNSQIRCLELERHDLIQSQGSRRGTINHLEEQCSSLRAEVKTAQSELNQQRALYCQVKTLQEQTDAALADSQCQIAQLECELSKASEKLWCKSKNRDSDEARILKNEVCCLKQKLVQLDQEKDSLLICLDDKTERIAMLEQELKLKDSNLAMAENTVSDLKSRLCKNADDHSAKDQQLRSHSMELSSVRRELEATERTKDNALQELRNCQNTVACVTADCKIAHTEIEQYKRQTEDLKRQLQTYVAEVKRFEDIMNEKELERSKLLHQFKSLSDEANLLEVNNHSLEHEATQSKVQLSVTLDHVSDLENKLTTQDNIICNYERQITDFRLQLSKLEDQVRYYQKQQEHNTEELDNLRDLCSRLDTQKDSLSRELQDRNDQKKQINHDMVRLRCETETLQTTLMRDRASLENLEKLLCEAREEAAQQRLHNDELENEVRLLKQQIEEYQSRLPSTSPTMFTYTTGLPLRNTNTFCTCCKSCYVQNKGKYIDTAGMVTSSPKCTSYLCKCCGKLTLDTISENCEKSLKNVEKQSHEDTTKWSPCHSYCSNSSSLKKTTYAEEPTYFRKSSTPVYECLAKCSKKK
ncbi:hypothetical protein FQA39_LY00463 [Lamprigera yunnana]|nr:hypothetical protein FQA39_LY00463 [Lamprigera yunnana]